MRRTVPLIQHDTSATWSDVFAAMEAHSGAAPGQQGAKAKCKCSVNFGDS